MYLGYVSLDQDRRSIWSGYPEWRSPERASWVRTGESYGGAPPGGCPHDGCDPALAPVDAARLEYQGPLRSYGAMVIGGTGGCTLTLAGHTGNRLDPVVPSVVQPGGSAERADADVPAAADRSVGLRVRRAVSSEDQQILCLLPLDAGPEGRCPGENLR